MKLYLSPNKAIDIDFAQEKYCPNCKQNVHPTKEWGGVIIGDIFLLILFVFLLGGLFGVGFWLIIVFLEVVSPFNTSCPMCRMPRHKLEPKK